MMLLENLIAAGVRECLVFGWAGALRPDVPLGGLFAIKEAFSAEGTSRFYLPQGVFSPTLSDGLKGLLYGLSLPWGRTVSIDAPYRETVSFCEEWAPRVEMVDMEVSALYAVARFRDIKILALLVISDLVYPERVKAHPRVLKEWRPRLLPWWQRFLEGELKFPDKPIFPLRHKHK